MIQLQFLNKLLDEGDFSLVTLNNIDKSYFSDYENEFDYIKNHCDKYGNIPDKTSFLNMFPSFDIIKVNESDNYLLDELYRDKKNRYLTTTFNQMRNLIMSNKTEDALTLLQNVSNNATQCNNIKSLDILKNKDRYEDYLDKCNDYTKFYVGTGFPELDNIIGGWDRKEELATITARPGVGKSWFLLKVALEAAKQGLTVGLYSGEMSESKVGYRMDTLISHISNWKIMHGNTSIQSDYKNYLDSVDSKIKGSLKILTPNMIGGPAGVSALRSFIEKDKLDILCIDQHSLLEDDRKAKNPVEKAANISKDLKNLQVMKKIPIIAVSQQNRNSVESGVSTANIAQADRIGQDSTIVIFLEQKDGVLSVKLVKSRDSGSNKELKYKIDYDKGTYINIPIEEDKPESKEDKESEDIRLSYELDDISKGGNPF